MIRRRSVLKNAGALAALTGMAPAVLAETAVPARSWIPNDTMISRLEDLFKKRNVAGASFAILEEGEVAWAQSFGFRNTTTQDRITNNTLFQVASLSKPIFAYVVMNMIEQGRIKLDDRLSDYVRPIGYSGTPWSRAITIRHVLTHQTGLPNWRERSEGVPLEPAVEPGTGYSYSGEAYSWLQEVVEAIENASLHEVASHYLFAPAGLEDMAFLWLPDRDRREVFGHSLDASGQNVPDGLQFSREYGSLVHKVATRWGRELSSLRQADIRTINEVIEWPVGSTLADRPKWLWKLPDYALANAPSSARATASDYARFLALMLPDQNQPAGLISNEARKFMLTPQSERPDQPNMPSGIGWGLERFQGRLYYQHWGRNGANYTALSLADPVTKRGIVAMANSETGGPFIDEAAAMLTGTPFKTFV